ncbi:MAG: hypothetical protein KBF12_11975 [Sebaldella sp.]|nr:hypothetical protein [Sebaldella sp.]
MLYKEIKELFNNRKLFSKLIVEMDINEIKFHDRLTKIWSENGIVEGKHARVVMINKEFDSQASFALLFKYILFYWEEWEKEDVLGIKKEDWTEAIKNQWIPYYFNDKYIVLDELLPFNFFKDSKFYEDFPEEYEKLKKSYEGIRITNEGYKLFTGSYFGMTDDVYYYYEAFIND